MPTSPESISLIRSTARRLASSSRDGPTSVAPILAELSIRKMKRSPVSCRAFQLGRNSASSTSNSSSNCSNSSRFFRNRCQIEFTCRSSIDLCHRYVLGTSSGIRLSLRK